MTRADAYKYLLLGATVQAKFTVMDRAPLSHTLGSTVPLDAYYRKDPGNDRVMWSSHIDFNEAHICAAYDPIFIDEARDFDWEKI